MFSPKSHATKKLVQKKAFAVKRARQSFVSSIVSAKPTPEVEKRNQEAGEMAARAKKAEFLQQYRAVAKADRRS